MENKVFLQLALILGGALLLGLVIRTWIIPFLFKIANKTKQQGDNLILKSFKKWILVLMLALGFYVGEKNIPMSDKYHVWINQSILLFYIFCATLMTAEIVSGMIRVKTHEAESTVPSSSIINKMARVIIYGLGLVLMLQTVGISVAPILTAMGVGGLAVALALQDTLSNLFAGLQIIASGKINRKDFIRLDNGQEGFVEDISWRITTIRNAADQVIIVPNAKLSNMITTNYLLEKKNFTVHSDVYIDRSNDLRKVEAVTLEVATQTLEQVTGKAAPGEVAVRFHKFGENSVEMKVNFTVHEFAQQSLIVHRFILQLKERFEQEGIQMANPVKV